MIRNPQRAELTSLQDGEGAAAPPDSEISTAFDPLAWRESQVQEEFHVEPVRAIIQESGLRALVHPLTDDDLADHTDLADWIGQPLELDISTLDPPGVNQGIERFGKSDF